MPSVSELARSSVLFVVAGLCEIGGGYLVWQWWRNGRAWWSARSAGSHCFSTASSRRTRPAHFGRVYAAYGSWFVVLTIARLGVGAGPHAA